MVAEGTQLVEGEVYPRNIHVPLESFMYKKMKNTTMFYNRLATQI